MATRHEQGGAAAHSNVLSFAAARARRLTKANPEMPGWAHDIQKCCAYAAMVKAEHEAEAARVRFDQIDRGVSDQWWNGPQDIKERIHENNRQWETYCALIRHIAVMPAASRWEAALKRSTIGKMWLSDGRELGWLRKVRDGCLADDHLFPPSLKLGRA